MKIHRRFFPDPAGPTMDGIVAMGDEISVDILLEAYRLGIFPWPHPELPCLWFCPDERGILDFSDLHLSQSFKKFLKKTELTVTFNKNFEAVMRESSSLPRPGQSGTWITPLMLRKYSEFHKAGYAHSVEIWQGEDLVGGLYGVLVDGVFSGESMFYKVSNASKLALYKMIERLKAAGLTWMDIQMVTPVTESFGGRYISKFEFLRRLAAAHKDFNGYFGLPGAKGILGKRSPQGAPFSGS